MEAAPGWPVPSRPASSSPASPEKRGRGKPQTEIETDLLAAIRALERQLEEVRELDFEDDEDEQLDDGARLLIVANRLPVTLTVEDDGSIRWAKSSGGLAEAIECLLRAQERDSGESMQLAWIGWLGDEVDYEKQTALKTQMFSESSYMPVFLTTEQADLYYNGFCNDILWPLFNYVPLSTDSTVMQSKYWDSYVVANQVFADTVFETWRPGDMIWVHDYQLMLVPQMLRKKLQDVRIGFFLHTPFPTSEVYRVLPFREQILEALLACDLIGFHCFSYARDFLRSCAEILGLEVSPKGVDVGGRNVRIGIFPIGIDPAKWESRCNTDSVQLRLAELREQFAGKKVIVGIDRLDPIKGIPHKLIAMETFLDRYPEWQGKVVMIQVCVPSRTEVEKYANLQDDVNQLVGRINSKFGKVDFNPIHCINRSIDGDELSALYTLADMLAVTSLRDGMNLISFEFVACQREHCGVLLLSEFAGAAQNFSAAVQINPWNISETADSFNYALGLSFEERQERHSLLFEYVNKYTSLRWGHTFIAELQQELEIDEKIISRKRRLRKADVFNTYQKSQKRLLLLGYEGVLSRTGSLPKLSHPSKQLLAILRSLCRDPKNTVFLVCGHTRSQLTEWFGTLDIGLIAEHGCFVKWPGKDTDWQQTLPPQDESWRDAVLPILHSYASSVQGSFVYEKELTLSWAYHHAASEFGDWQANELMGYLNEVLSNVPIDAIMCRRFIELRPYGVTTQSVVASMFETGAEHEPEAGPERFITPALYDRMHLEGTRALFVIPEEGGTTNKDESPPVVDTGSNNGTALAPRADGDQSHEPPTMQSLTHIMVAPPKHLQGEFRSPDDRLPHPQPQPHQQHQNQSQGQNNQQNRHPPTPHSRPDEAEGYDFVFSMVDSVLDHYLLFNDPDASNIFKQRLAPDATEIYCHVGKDTGSIAPFFCRDMEEALQIVRAMGVASRKQAQVDGVRE